MIELTWFQREGEQTPEPLLKFDAFEKAQGAKVTYQATLDVCSTPRCPCYSAWVQCGVVGPDAPAHEFWLDLHGKSIEKTPELDAAPETLRVAEVIRAGLSDAAWDDLYRWFRAAKLKLIQTTDLDEVDLTDLPSAEDGQMVGFVEVFPVGYALDFTFRDRLWTADEQYCVQIKCNCKETILTFVPYEDAAGRRIMPGRTNPALRYNYHSHDTRNLAPGLPGSPPVRDLLEALKTAHPSMDLHLEMRHIILQTLYARQWLARIAAKIKSHVAAPAGALKKVVGRNEPCPCGSGKKFKKCCGR